MPVNQLLYRCMVSMAFRRLNSVGIVLESALSCNCKVVKFTKCPSSDGIGPVIGDLITDNVSKFESNPNDVGMVLVTLERYRSNNFKFVAKPISEGIVPARGKRFLRIKTKSLQEKAQIDRSYFSRTC